ncbi:MAG: DUF4405 domain-containing protein [bacterium]|nr:DUF4405 domain-containing protein [bacterium]
MNNKTSKPIKFLCILSFVIVAITSIPLFMNYIKGGSLEYSFITDLHVWSGISFIVFVGLRIIRTKFWRKK